MTPKLLSGFIKSDFLCGLSALSRSTRRDRIIPFLVEHIIVCHVLHKCSWNLWGKHKLQSVIELSSQLLWLQSTSYKSLNLDQPATSYQIATNMWLKPCRQRPSYPCCFLQVSPSICKALTISNNSWRSFRRGGGASKPSKQTLKKLANTQSLSRWMHRFQICHPLSSKTCFCQGTCKRKRPNWKRLLNLSVGIESKCHDMLGCMLQTQGIRCFTMSQGTACKLTWGTQWNHNEITLFKYTSVCKFNTYQGKQWNNNSIHPWSIKNDYACNGFMHFVPLCAS